MTLSWMGPYRALVEEYIKAANSYARTYRLPRLEFEGVALSAATVQVLEYILENEEAGQPMARLAERLGVTRGAFSKTVSQLSAQGLIQKQHPSQSSKDYVLTLTDKGRRVYDAYSRAVLTQVFSPLFRELDKMPPEQIDAMVEVFRLLNRDRQAREDARNE